MDPMRIRLRPVKVRPKLMPEEHRGNAAERHCAPPCRRLPGFVAVGPDPLIGQGALRSLDASGVKRKPERFDRPLGRKPIEEEWCAHVCALGTARWKRIVRGAFRGPKARPDQELQRDRSDPGSLVDHPDDSWGLTPDSGQGALRGRNLQG